ncbi:MAG: ABC transporter ATP-binding protein [Planctomycetota bacterium]|jgi:ABC-2 type transport system ATP-binding protein
MIQLENIRKQYERCVALKQISLNLKYGKAYGLWGRNGAGKTTLIRIVLGVLSPDCGTVRVFGNDPKREWSVRREIGIVSDEDEYFPELTVEEFLWWVGKLRSIKDSLYQEQIKRYAQAFYIDEHRNHLISSLSHGTRRKVSVISAFIGKPKLIVMDEPINGLDIDSIEALCSLLRKHREEGGAALIACHDAAFMKEVCTDIIEIDKGRIIRHGPVGSVDI